MKVVIMNGTGGREMLEHVERPDPVAGPGQALIEVAFAGVNFMDIGVRQGLACWKSSQATACPERLKSGVSITGDAGARVSLQEI